MRVESAPQTTSIEAANADLRPDPLVAFLLSQAREPRQAPQPEHLGSCCDLKV